MRIFDEFNPTGDHVCPICGTNSKDPTMLVAMDGTEDGGICQAMQVHVGCVNLSIKKLDQGICVVYHTFRVKGYDENQT